MVTRPGHAGSNATPHRFDCVICFTYLYWTTWAALRHVQGRVPLVLHPTVHDEPPLRLSLFDAEFRAPDAFALSTPEEIDLIRDRFHLDPPGAVVGIGVEVGAADPARFRARIRPRRHGRTCSTSAASTRARARSRSSTSSSRTRSAIPTDDLVLVARR